MGGGHQRAVWEQQKGSLKNLSNWSDLAGDEVWGHGGEAVGEVAQWQGGRLRGGNQRAVWGQQKCLFGLP